MKITKKNRLKNFATKYSKSINMTLKKNPNKQTLYMLDEYTKCSLFRVIFQDSRKFG